MADCSRQNVSGGSGHFFTQNGDLHVYSEGAGPSRSAKPRHVFILPVKSNKLKDFTGRGEECKRLEELLLAPDGKKLAGIVGLAGIGGIGKSALASYFAEQHKADFPDGVIGLPVNKKEPAAIVREFARTADVKIAEDDTREPAVLMQEIFAWQRMLLIFDNAETDDICELHPGGQCAVIVTTRDRSLPVRIDADLVEVPPLPESDARVLLAHFVGQARLDAEPEAAARILAVTGNLPLAVEIAGKMLKQRHRLRLKDYADSLKLDSLKLPRSNDFSVRACFMQSIRLLEAEGRDDLIVCFARLAACAQSGFALATAMAAAGEADEQAALEKLEELTFLSLLNYVEESAERFFFHPLLHEFAEELAKERNMLYLSRRQHANYLIGRLRSQEPDELAADLEDFVQVAEWFTESEDAGYVDFYLKLKQLFDRLGYWEEAERIASIFLRRAEQEQDIPQVVQFYVQRAKFRLLKGDFTQAEAFLRAADAQIQTVEPEEERKHLQAMQLNSLGGVYQRLGLFDKAVEAFKKSAEIGEELKDQRHLAMVLNSLGGVYQRLGLFDKAIEAFKKSYELAVSFDDQRGQAMVLNSLGGVYQRQGKFDEAVHAFTQSAEIEEKLNNQRGQAMVLNSLGGVYQRQGKFDEAVHAFTQSAEIEEKLNNQRGQAMVLNSLGGVYQRQGKFDDAVLAFQQSYDISSRLEDERSLAMVLNSLGGVYQRQGKFDNAVLAFQQSLKIEEELKDERGQAMVLNSLGSAHQLQDKFDEAVQFFAKSAAIGEKLNDRRHLAMVCTAWGRALLRQHQPAQALAQLQRGFTIDEVLKNTRGMEIVTPLLCQALRQLGRYSEALAFCKRALAVAPENSKLLALHKSLQEPLLTGTIKFIKPSRDGDHSFGYITMDDHSEDVRFDSRYVDISGLTKDMRVAVAVRTNRWGKPQAQSLRKIGS